MIAKNEVHAVGAIYELATGKLTLSSASLIIMHMVPSLMGACFEPAEDVDHIDRARAPRPGRTSGPRC